MTTRVRIAGLLVAGLAFTPAAACNVFLTVDRCQSDGDCPTDFVCDPAGRFCADTRRDSGTDSAMPDVLEQPDVSVDAPIDAGPPCDPSAPFGPAVLVPGLEDLPISSARFTPDEQTVLYAALNGCSQEVCFDLFAARRSGTSAPFVVSGALGGVNTSASSEYWPTLTADGLLLFFESSRSVEKVGGSYVNDRARIWTATRVNRVAEFSEPRIQSIFAVDGMESSPYLHPGGRSLYFSSNARRDGGTFDIYLARLDGIGLASQVENISAINTEAFEGMPVISADERTLYFGRETKNGTRNIYVTTRPDADAAFGQPSLVSELSTEHDEFPSWIAPDSCRLYFISTRPSATSNPPTEGRLWMAARPK